MYPVSFQGQLQAGMAVPVRAHMKLAHGIRLGSTAGVSGAGWSQHNTGTKDHVVPTQQVEPVQEGSAQGSQE